MNGFDWLIVSLTAAAVIVGAATIWCAVVALSRDGGCSRDNTTEKGTGQ